MLLYPRTQRSALIRREKCGPTALVALSPTCTSSTDLSSETRFTASLGWSITHGFWNTAVYGTDARAQRLTQADRDKRWVALSSLVAAILLTGTKLGIGLWSNSLGILSEAAHSGLDLVAAAVTLWAVRVSGRPADREHPYGHGKIENLSALFETALLLVTCVWIIGEAAKRLFFAGEVHVDPNVWAFLVVLLSMAVDYSRSRALKKAADKYASQALEADALHFSTDIWSSAVVLLGLCGVLAGKRLGMPWLVQADAVAALGVAAIVIGVSLKLGKKSVDDLLDGVPKGLQEQVAAAVQQVPGVEAVTRLRLRRSGPEIFADVTLAVGHAAAFERHTTSPTRLRRPCTRCCPTPTWWFTSSRLRPGKRTSPRWFASWPRGTAWAPRHSHLRGAGAAVAGVAPRSERCAVAGRGPPPGDGV